MRPPLSQGSSTAARSPSRARGATGSSKTKKKKRKADPAEWARRYVVEELTDLRVNDQGEKQVLVEWEEYKRRTWEPYTSMQQQLPEMVQRLEDNRRDAQDPSTTMDDAHHAFLLDFIAAHHVDANYRWSSDRLIVLEHAAASLTCPIKDTAKKLQQSIMELVHAGEV